MILIVYFAYVSTNCYEERQLLKKKMKMCWKSSYIYFKYHRVGVTPGDTSAYPSVVITCLNPRPPAHCSNENASSFFQILHYFILFQTRKNCETCQFWDYFFSIWSRSICVKIVMWRDAPDYSFADKMLEPASSSVLGSMHEQERPFRACVSWFASNQYALKISPRNPSSLILIFWDLAKLFYFNYRLGTQPIRPLLSLERAREKKRTDVI